VEFSYRCTECERSFDISPDLMLCPYCSAQQADGQPLRGLLEVHLEHSPGGDVSRRGHLDLASLLRGSPPGVRLLPVDERHFPAVPFAPTPLWEPERLRAKLGLSNLFIKDDTGLPTGSLKDRASLLVAAFAREHGIGKIVVASTGNAASSMAGIGAVAGLVVKVFVPASAPRAKLVQCLQYGAQVELVDGTYDDAYAASLAYERKHGGLCRNTGYNPLTTEGKKTVALEIAAQLGRAPDHVFVPTGDGVVLGGVYKGFEDLVRLGLIDTVPTVHAVQATGSNAIARAMRARSDRDGFAGATDHSQAAHTIADSIAVRVPANGYGAVRKLRAYGGRCLEVTDEQILAAQHELAKTTGVFAEPAAAASYAGLLVSTAGIAEGETVVIMATGSGLKDVDAASRAIDLPGDHRVTGGGA